MIYAMWLQRANGERVPTIFTNHLLIPDEADARAFIEQVEQFYATHTTEQIAAINAAAEAEFNAAQDADELVPGLRKAIKGYVYVIKQVGGIYYKIGCTVKPTERMRRFEVVLPFPIEPIHLIASDDMVALERELHARYAHRHVEGEWYALTDEDVREIGVLA